jgi:signal recognition particle receptor subunit beta
VAHINYTAMQVTAKIVFYGPGLCGKTTNLQFIHKKTAPSSRGEMLSLETETDRTLFFDLLPLDVGIIRGMKVRLQLYTVPGQVFYNATRKLVLKGVDGIIFVGDSQEAARDANIESLANLKANLAELGIELHSVPLVFQYNKRDLRSILSVEDLNRDLNPQSLPYHEAAAFHGVGVFETLKGISRLALASIRAEIEEHETRRSPSAAAHAPGAEAMRPAAEPQPRAPDPVLPQAGGTTAREEPLEFAEEDTGRHSIRPVRTREHADIQAELEKLRTSPSARPSRPSPMAGAAKDLDRRLQDLLGSDKSSRLEVKRKVAIDVPSHLLKESGSLRVQVAFETGDGESIHEAVRLNLPENRRLERLVLQLELDVKGKPDS